MVVFLMLFNPASICFKYTKLASVCVLPAAVYVICKQGNDSQKAVRVLEKMSGSEVDAITIKDISGGLMAWAKTIDPTFPLY